MRPNRGFTLVELLVSLLVGAIVISGVYASFQLVQGQYNSISTRADVNELGRAVLRVLERDLRMSGFSYYDDTAGYSGQVIQKQSETKTLSSPPENVGLVIQPDHKAFRVVYDYVDVDDSNSVERQVITYSLESEDGKAPFRLMRHLDQMPTQNTVPELMAEHVEDFYIYQGKSDISNKLVACFGFNTSLKDEITGLLATGSASYTSGVIDNSLVLSGVALQVPNSSNISFENDFSISLFVQADMFPSSSLALLNIDSGNYLLNLDKNGRLKGELFPGDPTRYSAAEYGSLSLGSEKNIAVVRKGNLLQIFLGATVVAQHTITGSFGTSVSNTRFAEDTAGGFDLKVDDLRFYARALELAELWSISSNSYQDCNAGNSSLINLAIVLRSRRPWGSSRTYTSPGYIPNSADFSTVTDDYYRKAFATSVMPRNL